MTRKVESADEEVVFECDFEEAPEKVWRALTEPELRDAWLSADDSGAVPKPGATELEVLQAEPHRLLRFACRDHESPGERADREPEVVESTVTFELSRSAAGGTHLRLIHTDFRLASPRRSTVCSLAAARVTRAKRTRTVSCLSPQALQLAA